MRRDDRYVIPDFKPMPKKRPRGNFRPPQEYFDWKDSLRSAIADKYDPLPVFGPILLHIEIHSPNRPRGDVDNLAGAVMDAIQPPRSRADITTGDEALKALCALYPGVLYSDDKQVNDLRVRWVKDKKRSLVIHLRELTEGEQADGPGIG